MKTYIRRIGPGWWLISAFAIWIVVLAVARASTFTGQAPAVKPVAAASNPAPPAQTGDWSASDCEVCHAAAAGPAFQHTAHARQSQSCAACHRNVAEHVKARKAGDPKAPSPSLKTLKAKDLNAVCLTCHEKNNQLNFVGSTHDRRNVACTSCHSVHSYQSDKAQLKTAQDPETCFTCHASMRAKSMRTSHHPLAEGKMGCTSCHNPHDGSRPKMLKADTVNELCYKCHTEKRGPFLWEHAPVRDECVICHDPHGSNHERLLVARQPYLCQRCHFSGHGLNADRANTLQGVQVAPAGSSATISVRNIEDGCKGCHIAIHGSNSPSGARFMR